MCLLVKAHTKGNIYNLHESSG